MPSNVIEPPKTWYKRSPIAFNLRPTFSLSKQKAELTTATESGHYFSFASAQGVWRECGQEETIILRPVFC